MSQRFFTADPHAGHLYMAQLRGFASIEEHDERLVLNWNEEVGKQDLVFVAGDAAMGDRKQSLQLFRRMNGRKILITGNHDDCWPGQSNSWTKLEMYQEFFFAIQPFARLAIDRRLVLISHFPYSADHTDPPRFMQYRLRNQGAWLLHGHTHRTSRWTSPRQIHIGMDAWDMRPVAESRIIAMMRGQYSKEADKHEPAPSSTSSRHPVTLPQADDQGARQEEDPADENRAGNAGTGSAGTPRHPE